MPRRSAFLGLLFFAVCALVVPSTASAGSAELAVTSLALPEGKQTKEFERTVRSALMRAARSFKFGKSKRVEVTVRLKEFTVTEEEGLVRVTCTLIGRLKGGGT